MGSREEKNGRQRTPSVHKKEPFQIFKKNISDLSKGHITHNGFHPKPFTRPCNRQRNSYKTFFDCATEQIFLIAFPGNKEPLNFQEAHSSPLIALRLVCKDTCRT